MKELKPQKHYKKKIKVIIIKELKLQEYYKKKIKILIISIFILIFIILTAESDINDINDKDSIYTVGIINKKTYYCLDKEKSKEDYIANNKEKGKEDNIAEHLKKKDPITEKKIVSRVPIDLKDLDQETFEKIIPKKENKNYFDNYFEGFVAVIASVITTIAVYEFFIWWFSNKGGPWDGPGGGTGGGPSYPGSGPGKGPKFGSDEKNSGNSQVGIINANTAVNTVVTTAVVISAANTIAQTFINETSDQIPTNANLIEINENSIEINENSIEINENVAEINDDSAENLMENSIEINENVAEINDDSLEINDDSAENLMENLVENLIKINEDSTEIKEKEELNIPKEKEVLNIPKEKEVLNIPKEKEVLNIPKEKEVLNIPKEKEELNIPKEKEELNIPKEKEELNIPKEKEELNEKGKDNLNLSTGKNSLRKYDLKEDLIMTSDWEYNISYYFTKPSIALSKMINIFINEVLSMQEIEDEIDKPSEKLMRTGLNAEAIEFLQGMLEFIVEKAEKSLSKNKQLLRSYANIINNCESVEELNYFIKLQHILKKEILIESISFMKSILEKPLSTAALNQLQLTMKCLHANWLITDEKILDMINKCEQRSRILSKEIQNIHNVLKVEVNEVMKLQLTKMLAVKNREWTLLFLTLNTLKQDLEYDVFKYDNIPIKIFYIGSYGEDNITYVCLDSIITGEINLVDVSDFTKIKYIGEINDNVMITKIMQTMYKSENNIKDYIREKLVEFNDKIVNDIYELNKLILEKIKYLFAELIEKKKVSNIKYLEHLFSLRYNYSWWETLTPTQKMEFKVLYEAFRKCTK